MSGKEWLPELSSLVLGGTGIEIKTGRNAPYTLYTPNYPPLGFYSLENAKRDGERIADELAQFCGCGPPDALH